MFSVTKRHWRKGTKNECLDSIKGIHDINEEFTSGSFDCMNEEI